MLKEKISEDIKIAMKARDAKKLSVLRMMLSEIKYAQAQTNLHADISDQDVQKIVETYGKKLEKGLADFPEGDKKAEVIAEIQIVKSYLPKKASPEETHAAITEILKNTQDKNFGNLMKLVQEKLHGNGDNKLISATLKEKLT